MLRKGGVKSVKSRSGVTHGSYSENLWIALVLRILVQS